MGLWDKLREGSDYVRKLRLSRGPDSYGRVSTSARMQSTSVRRQRTSLSGSVRRQSASVSGPPPLRWTPTG
jgi:hypothetical protein